MYASEYIMGEEVEEKESCSTCCCIFWILAILALILLLCVGGYYLFKDKDTEKIDPVNTGGDHRVVIPPINPVVITVQNKEYPGYQYNDDGTWKDYDAATSYLLFHQSHSRRDLMVNIGGEKMFSIDFTQNRQYNLKWDKQNRCHIFDNNTHKY